MNAKAILREPPRTGHFVRFYERDAVLLDEVVDFIDTALRAGGAGVVIATAEHLAALRPRLAGFGAHGAQKGWFPGELRLFDAQTTLDSFMIDNWPDENRFNGTVGTLLEAAAAEGRTVHAFGEMVALLCAEGKFEAALELETLWTALARKLSFNLFCAYPAHVFADSKHGAIFQEICTAHDHVCLSESVSSPAKDPDDVLRLLGAWQQKATALEAELARRRLAEQTLRRREKELSDFVENAAEGLHRVGSDGTILWANQAELDLLGYSHDEYVGRHITAFHVDAPVIESILTSLQAGETLCDRPARLRCKDGSVKHVLIHSNGYFEDGKLVYTRCFTRDATDRIARQQAEVQRDNLLMNAPVAAALLTGPELTFRIANGKYCEILGRTDLVGRTLEEIFPAPLGAEAIAISRRVFDTGEPFSTDEFRMELAQPDGALEERFFKAHLEPLYAPDGAVEGIISVSVDMTEQVRARRGLELAFADREQLLTDLEEASRAKDEFLAMLGHELRNPLSPIVTALQLMRMRGDSTTAREQGIIQRQVEHLVRLVDDLLDISKITRGKILLKKEWVDVSAVLTEAVEITSLLLEQRHHHLVVEIEPDLRWEGDPVRLAQVVANLLTNAARYTDVGGKVSLSARRGSGDSITVSVRDNGQGIATEMLPQVFTLFYQGRRSFDRAEGGLGIGLALVKTLVEMHGGTVAAASDGRGHGSEFTFTIPVSSQAPSAFDERAEAALESPIAATRPHRVLVVDDNVDGAEALGQLLQVNGHVVRVVHDPVSALDVAEAFSPDVAVLDIGLPVMDGYELAIRLRERLGSQSCRLIAISGYGQEADRDRSQAAGFEQHVVKPIDPKAILALLSEG